MRLLQQYTTGKEKDYGTISEPEEKIEFVKNYDKM